MATVTETRPASKSSRKPLTVELTLCLNGTSYTVEPIAHAPGGLKSFRLAKVGGDSAVYDLDAFDDRVECSCPSYRKTHAGTSSLCKHSRALVICGLVEYPTVQEQDPRDAYNDHREKMAAIEAEIRSEVESPSTPVGPAFDPEPYDIANVVARGDACWINAGPKGGPTPPCWTPRESPAPCCHPVEPEPCAACRTFEGPGDLSDTDGWEDGYVWSIGSGPDPDDGPAWTDPVDMRTWDPSLDAEDDGPDARSLAEMIDAEAAHYRTLRTDFGDLLAETIAKLAAEVRFLDASTPAGYRDRKDAMLDAELARIEARIAARC